MYGGFGPLTANFLEENEALDYDHCSGQPKGGVRKKYSNL